MEISIGFFVLLVILSSLGSYSIGCKIGGIIKKKRFEEARAELIREGAGY